MQSSVFSTSCSASRQGRSCPSNLFPGGRSTSDERPWPSPSFNGSMSLAKVDDVFADRSSRSNDATAMKRPLSRLFPTPITAGMTMSPGLGLETTPKASEKAYGGQRAAVPMMQRSISYSSPPLQCPNVPRIGTVSEGLFHRDANLSPPSWQQPADFGIRPFDASVYGEPRSSDELSPQRMPTSRDVVGLGITFDRSSSASRSTATFRAQSADVSVDMSPPPAGKPFPATVASTDVTPLVRLARLDSTAVSAATPEAADTPTKDMFKASSSRTTLATPIKSKPLFRLDNGSSSSNNKNKVQGHKMHANESPWGVFGVKDEWRPLAAPNISRSGGVSAATARGSAGKDSPRTALAVRSAVSAAKENVAPPSQHATTASTVRPSTPGKRAARHSVDLCGASSPPKKQRSTERPKTGTGTPLKENSQQLAASSGVFRSVSPQKRMRAASSVGQSKQPIRLR